MRDIVVHWTFTWRFGKTRLAQHLLFGGVGLVFTLCVSSQIAWDTWRFWTMHEASLLVGLTALTYLLAWIWNHKVERLPRPGGAGQIILNVSLAFLVLIGVLALGRLYYSRSFLLITYLSTLLWQLLGYALARKTPLRLALVPGGIAMHLKTLPGVRWRLLESPHLSGGEEIDGVVVDMHVPLSPAWMRFLAECSLQGLPVHHAALVYETLSGRVSLEHLSDGIIDRLAPPFLYLIVKRLLDMLVVCLTLPLTFPLFLLVALAIRLDSRGPVIFWQQRVGEGGKPFWMAKFRTMHVDAEKDGARFAADKDERVTCVGYLLRRFRLDELPQLWNVLKGEMSLIGPRPEQVPFAEKFAQEIPFYTYRHLVKPGITGWAQVNQGYAAGAREAEVKLTYDLYYIKYLSPWLDFEIILRTLLILLTGFGAR